MQAERTAESGAPWWFRGLLCVLGLGWIGEGLLFLMHLREQLDGPLLYAKDFLADYVVGRALAEGVNPYAELRTLANRYIPEFPVITFPHPMPHPPPDVLLFWSLAWLDYPSSARLWLGFELVCLLAAVHLLLCDISPRSP